MERYDYHFEMSEVILKFLVEQFDWSLVEGLDLDGAVEELVDYLWDNEGITGNVRDGYFHDAWHAEEAVCHNLDLLQEALSDFEYEFWDLKQGAAWADSLIRCYLLRDVLREVLAEYFSNKFGN